jgi:hypothetical protein
VGDPREIKGRSGREIQGRYEKIWRRQRKSQDEKSMTDTERSGGRNRKSRGDTGRFMVNTDLREM